MKEESETIEVPQQGQGNRMYIFVNIHAHCLRVHVPMVGLTASELSSVTGVLVYSKCQTHMLKFSQK